MSTAAPPNNRIFLQGGVLLIAACLAVAGAAALTRDTSRGVAGTDGPAGPRAPRIVAAPDQAPWKVKTWPAGSLGRNVKVAEEVALRARPRLLGIVRRTYEALFLAPGSLREVLAGDFTPKAARRLAATGAGVPRDASEVRLLRRRALISVDARGGARAAVQVSVKARVTVAAREATIAHRSVLWLDRKKGDWKVIGFDLLQRRIR